jgi:hypothetical protein
LPSLKRCSSQARISTEPIRTVTTGQSAQHRRGAVLVWTLAKQTHAVVSLGRVITKQGASDTMDDTKTLTSHLKG